MGSNPIYIKTLRKILFAQFRVLVMNRKGFFYSILFESCLIRKSIEKIQPCMKQIEIDARLETTQSKMALDNYTTCLKAVVQNGGHSPIAGPLKRP
jgi:hypothetical protein